MTKEQKICDILAREYPDVYADIEKQIIPNCKEQNEYNTRVEQAIEASPYGNSYQTSAFVNGVMWADKTPKEVKSEEVEMWVARDDDGTGRIFYDKPFEDLDDWDSPRFWSSLNDCIPIDDNYFPSVTFENSPKRVKLILEE